jgi:hypothetical protein
MITAFEREKTVHDLDRAATVTGIKKEIPKKKENIFRASKYSKAELNSILNTFLKRNFNLSLSFDIGDTSHFPKPSPPANPSPVNRKSKARSLHVLSDLTAARRDLRLLVEMTVVKYRG